MKKITYKDLNALLAKINHLSYLDRLIRIINFRLNTPYKKIPFKKEILNTIPFFPIRYSDCVSFILTSMAIALSKSVMQAKLNIIPLHYKKNKVSYKTRYHFTEDRILNNEYFTNISDSISSVKYIEFILNRKKDSRKLIDIPFQEKVKMKYLSPGSFISNINSIKDTVLNIAFCRLNNIENGHFVSHEGFLINGKYLFHASQTYRKVVKIRIEKYIDKYKWDGIIISRNKKER